MPYTSYIIDETNINAPKKQNSWKSDNYKMSNQAKKQRRLIAI